MIQIYMGEGKGKTTAALGQCLRARGRNKKCLWTSFLKSYDSGEFLGLMPFDLEKGEPVHGFFFQMSEEQKSKLRNEHSYRLQCVVNRAPQYQVIVLDEILGAIECGILSQHEVVEQLQLLPSECEVILTGRKAPQQLLNMADYVSQIEAIKHPCDRGVAAREGIEY